MKFNIGKSYDVTVYLVSKDQELSFLSNDLADYVSSTLEYTGKSNEVYSNLGPNSENVVLVGLGEADKITKNDVVKAVNSAAKELNRFKVQEVNVQASTLGDIDEETAVKGVVEGFIQADYSFDSYKSEKTEHSLQEVNVLSELSDVENIIGETVNVLSGVNVTRDLVNTPANDLYPETLADKVTESFKDMDVEVDVFNKSQLEEMDAKALLAVSKGSDKEPRLIVLKYLPLGKDESAVSLVGKGVTYDSGGYALKNPKGMATMKIDMAGAASMIGTVYALAKNNIQKNVVAVIAATENMVSGAAMKNGDVIGSMKGSTIEVLNTDAEGRLILGDALYYAATKVNSRVIVDAATLTGAVVAALGKNITGTLTNNQDSLDALHAASKQVGEDMWQLPITKEFQEKTKGKITDLVNIPYNPAGAGTIFAAAFLEHFVEEVPWIHLDIAGTSYSKSGNTYLPDGASGIPVKSLYEFVKNQ